MWMNPWLYKRNLKAIVAFGIQNVSHLECKQLHALVLFNTPSGTQGHALQSGTVIFLQKMYEHVHEVK